MRKLSKINEGMFDQGIKRAHTGEVRTEDDVNILSPEDFAIYISKNYKFNDSDACPLYSTGDLGKSIIFKVKYGMYYYHFFIDYDDNEKIYEIICWMSIDKLKDLNLDTSKYSFRKNNQGVTVITPVIGEMNNKFALDFLDDLIEEIDKVYDSGIKKINEGMFDNGIKRTHTEEVRTEDNVDNLTSKGLYDYINKHYINTEGENLGYIYPDGDSLYIKIWHDIDDDHSVKFMIDFNHGEIVQCSTMWHNVAFHDNNPNLVNLMKSKYDVSGGNDNIYKPKNYKEGDTINNSFCLDVLDTLLENGGKYIIVKKRK